MTQLQFQLAEFYLKDSKKCFCFHSSEPPRKQPEAQIKRPFTDPHQLNALLQTVYKRRALKAAGAVVSTPNKGEMTKLGNIENIKFLIVTANLADLEILHHLIFMSEASKSRLRKNILDFDGFRFNEDSKKYHERIEFLYSLGYDVSKRISFLLGLCPLQTDIPQQDLNELIMYFLMSPCRTKQVIPITEMPKLQLGTPGESFIMLKSTFDAGKNVQYQSVLQSSASPPKQQLSTSTNIHSSTPIPKVGQKARKSFHSIPNMSPVKRVLLPPSQSSIVGTGLNKQAVRNKSSVTLLNSVPAVSSYSLSKMPANVTVLNAPSNLALVNTGNVSNVNSLVRLPVNLGTKVQILNQPSNVTAVGANAKIPASSASNVTGQIFQNPVIIPQMTNKIEIQPQNVLQTPLLQGSKVVMKPPSGVTSSAPQEFLVQQQTPDGQQKTFKLIRLPPNHPLASVVSKTSTQQNAFPPPVAQTVATPPVTPTIVAPSVARTVLAPPVARTVLAPPVAQTVVAPPIQQQVIFTNSPATGLVFMKNSAALSSTVQNIQDLKNVPIKGKTNICISQTGSSISITKPDEFILPDEGESAETLESSKSADAINPVPPTDEDLFRSIQEIILSSNFEDITLRNVIERVSGQFPQHDLTHRHNYMKDCVKKIIIGT